MKLFYDTKVLLVAMLSIVKKVFSAWGDRQKKDGELALKLNTMQKFFLWVSNFCHNSRCSSRSKSSNSRQVHHTDEAKKLWLDFEYLIVETLV